jgi:hypothetical protein
MSLLARTIVCMYAEHITVVMTVSQDLGSLFVASTSRLASTAQGERESCIIALLPMTMMILVVRWPEGWVLPICAGLAAA